MAKKKDTIKTDGMFSYEAFCVYKILNGHPKNSNAKFLISEIVDDFAFSPDVYAPDGIPSLDIKGETVIEIKKNLSFSTINYLRSYIETHSQNYNILIVYFHSTLSSEPEQSEINGHIVKYIQFSNLKGKINTQNLDKFYADRIKNNDWKDERKNIIERANKSAKLGKNVLFLGAGVSKSAKMPTWDELLEGLMSEVKQLKEPTLTAFKELSSHVLNECGNSYLIMARYLQTAIHQYDKDVNFSELIQKYLYNGKNQSDLLDALSSIIQLKKVNEVITYNFDDILEQNLKKKGLSDPEDFTSISKDAEIKGHNTMPIYHVHGIIPQYGATDTVVFSEEEYHDRYSNSYHWSNVEQLHALSRMHCFFIGLSMNDPNLRRLLDVAHKMNKTNEDPHFAFLKRTKMEDYCIPGVEKSCKYVHISKSLVDSKKQKEIYDLNYGVIEKIFRELGVQVIWYEEHNDLPDIIAEVFQMSKYKRDDTKNLIDRCDAKIAQIKKIEDGIPSFNPATMKISDVAIFMTYKHENGATYKTLIDEVNDMLNELSSRLKDDLDTLLKLQKQIPSYNDSFSGFASFYSLWLEFVKICLV